MGAMQRKSQFFQRALPALTLLALGLVLTLVTASSTWNRERLSAQKDFEAAAENRLSALKREIDAHLALTNAVAEALSTVGHNGRDDVLQSVWKIHSLRFTMRWAPRVGHNERADFEQHLRTSFGVPHILAPKDGRLVRSPVRPEYFPLALVQPDTEENRKVRGLDAAARPECLDAMRRAFRVRRPSATTGLELVQRYSQERGVLTFAAVVDRSNGQLRGYVQSLVYPSDLVDHAFRTLEPSGVHVQFFDGAEARTPLYEHSSRRGAQVASHLEPIEKMLQFADRRWLIRCTPSSAFRFAKYPVFVAAIGFILSLLLSLYVHSYVNRAQQVEREVDERTEALRRTMKELEEEVTQRRATEEALARARDEALAATRLKSQFLANVSHEIRTPINGVMGLIDILGDTDLNPAQAEALALLRRCSRSLRDLIQDLLDMSRIEAGKLEIRSAPFELTEIVQDAVAAVRQQAIDKQLRLTWRVEANSGTFVSGDAGRLRQVLVNLLGNAVKFTRQGFVELRAIGPADHLWRFEIEDSGPGVAVDDQELIFGRFQQADGGSARQAGGLGLGLAISRQIIEAMNGRMNVRSLPGQGATFWFEVPLPQIGPEAEAPRSVLPSRAAEKSRVRVLLAEDNLVNQKVTMRYLQKLGLQADCVENGFGVLDALQRQRYDLILMDCQMPEMDGFEATQRLRAMADECRNVPVIALTANAMQGDRERCLTAGMNDYVTKPVDLQRLATAIERQISDSVTSMQLS